MQFQPCGLVAWSGVGTMSHVCECDFHLTSFGSQGTGKNRAVLSFSHQNAFRKPCKDFPLAYRLVSTNAATCPWTRRTRHR